MKFIAKASLIPDAENTNKRFIVPTILANRYSATFVFWKWMITIQWGNF
jgi:hypothetical protein